MLNLGEYNKMNMVELMPLKPEEVVLETYTISQRKDFIVEIVVTPVMTINGTHYLGVCHVSQGVAGVLRHMMQSYKKGIEKIFDGTDHGTKHLGEIRG